MRWCLIGCLERQRIGLASPKVVTDATDAYFEDQDTTKQWLEDCTQDSGPYAFTPSSQLYSSWKAWCEERGFKPGSAKALADALNDRGYTPKRAHGGVRGFSRLTISVQATPTGDTW
jgi:phage/plasmid-associated DNA primase